MRPSLYCAIITSLILLTLGACAGDATGPGAVEQLPGAVGPQQIANATEIIKFDPALLPLGDAAPIAGTCAESSLVPGAYRCQPDGGDPAEPCFALSGARLACRPNPVTGQIAGLISPSAPLPSVAPPSIDRAVVFFVELDSGQTCAIRAAAEPVVLDAGTAGFECDTPYTYLVGDAATAFDKSAPQWTTTVYTLDPTTAGAATGVTAGVRRAWIP
jgi:hypothetical protein